VLIVANLGRALLLAAIPVLALRGQLSIAALVVIALLVGVCTVFFEVAYPSFLPRLVAHDQLVEANGKLTASASVAEIGGPGLAGVLIGLVTAPVAILADALSFLVSAASLLAIRTPEPTPLRADGRHLWRDVREGFAATFANPYLRAFAGEAATYNVCWNALQAVLVLYAVRALGLDAATLGVVLAIGSVGALLGALLTDRIARRCGIGATIVGASVLGAVSTLLIPLADGRTGGTLALLGLSLFLRGAGVTGCNVQVYALRQAITPDRLMGRTNGVYRLLTYGFIPLGALAGGVLGDRIGLRPTLAIGATGVSLSWLWLFFSPARTIQRLPLVAEDMAPVLTDD